MDDQGHIIGIDLGTTNSVVAVIEGNEPVVVPNAEGQPRLPSVVAYLEDGQVIVGEIVAESGHDAEQRLAVFEQFSQDNDLL